ncbi:MAG: hypothetical protein KGJ89_00975 [Patescibacteria group bacterium]|nr:hypothetical protein [Patescibacteria group bacterium]MDE2015086.1 hypothetical protein [Patescibacteria group bacterium]MDE2226514.1 hypothetical protein [Patescibacteria group bacterium]
MNNRAASSAVSAYSKAVIHPAVGGVYYLRTASSPPQAAGYQRADNKKASTEGGELLA